MKEKNLVEEKLEEASSSLKDNLNSYLYKFMPKLNVLVAGSTGYIGVQLIKLLLNIKKLILNIYVVVHLLEKKFLSMISLLIKKNYQRL